jgi:hypothetical protein
LIVTDNEEGTGWRTDWETTPGSSLRHLAVLLSVRDESVPTQAIGLRDQLLPLAELLDASTSLGAAQTTGLLPQATGPEGILARCVGPLAIHYLTTLTNVGQADPAAVDRIAAELGLLCDRSKIVHARQLTIGGINVAKALAHRNVQIRPLSPSERGAVLQSQQAIMLDRRDDLPEFVVPRKYQMFNPSVLLEATTSRKTEQLTEQPDLADRVALALFLLGFDFNSLGVLVGFDLPRWASFGLSYQPFPVTETVPPSNKTISQQEFVEVVNLAYSMPRFDNTESNGKAIALYRTLRGCGTPESAFLDFAIALDSALLSGIDTELAYRFRLYGGLFLMDERDPAETFRKLGNIYKVRSTLVHGSPVKSEDRQVAQQDASELARAVVKKAIVEGWPNTGTLDSVALRTGVVEVLDP